MKNLTSTLAGLILICFLSISCEKESSNPIDCVTGGPTVTATATKASCDSNDGSLQLTGAGGKAPYQYSIDGNTFQAGNNFASLEAGNYTVTIKDANNCTSTATASIGVDQASISYESTVKNIIATNCAIGTCHVSGGQGPGDFSQLSVVQSKAALVKTRTGNRSMPMGRTLTDEQIQQIACWVDAGAPNN